MGCESGVKLRVHPFALPRTRGLREWRARACVQSAGVILLLTNVASVAGFDIVGVVALLVVVRAVVLRASRVLFDSERLSYVTVLTSL